MRSIILSVLFLLVPVVSGAAIKDLSKDDWTSILQEIGIKAEQPMIEKLSRSSETLDKINLQTKGTLKSEEWINIFKKLSLEPKPGIQIQEWEKLFNKIGIKAKYTQVQEPQVLLKQETQKTTTAVDAPAVNTTNPPPPTQVSGQTSTVVPLVSDISQPQTYKPVPVTEPTKAPEIKPSKISLDLKGMDILSVLKMISQKSDLNIIAGNNVRGNVTIYLKDVDSIDALKMILEMNDLAYVYEDAVIKVMTAQDYEKIYGKRFYDRTTVEIIPLKFGKADNILKTLTSLKSKIAQLMADSASNSIIVVDTKDNIADISKIIATLDVKIETRVFSLSYSKAKDISDKLKYVLSPSISDVQIDERSNQLIITDASKKMDEISQFITSLDKRHREVLIEARIVQVMHDNSLNVGISWESVFSKINDQNMSGHVVGNLSNLTTPKTISVGGDNGIQLSLGTLSIDNFTAVLDMLQTVGKTDLVATPRIAAIENKEAKILVGTKEAYVTTQVTNPGSTTTNPVVAESVNFVDVGMKLYVTPNIGEDGFITMKIKPEVSSVDRTIKTSQNNTIPIVRTSESETTVMVKDGITIVIAGLMEEKEIKKDEGIPLLSRIPILGIPFRRTSSAKVKSELIVFLTPHIMTGELTSEEYNKKKK